MLKLFISDFLRELNKDFQLSFQNPYWSYLLVGCYFNHVMILYFALLISIWYNSNTPEQHYSNRKLLLVADHKLDSSLVLQQKILKADADGLAERDVKISIITAVTEKRSYDIWMKNKTGFLLILIGKDGGEKFHSEEPITLQQLYGIIDAMPMRRVEIKTRKNLK